MAFRGRLPVNFAPVTGWSVATLEAFDRPATGQRNRRAGGRPVASIVGHGGVADAPRHDRLDSPRKRAPRVSFPALRRPLHGAPLCLTPGCASGGPKRPRSPREADTDYGVSPCALMDQSGCLRRIDLTSFQHHSSAPHRASGRVCPVTCGHRSHRTTPMALLRRMRSCPVSSQSALPPARHRAGPPGHIRISACGRDHEADLIE